MRFENRRLVQQDFRQLVSYGTAVALPDHETTPRRNARKHFEIRQHFERCEDIERVRLERRRDDGRVVSVSRHVEARRQALPGTRLTPFDFIVDEHFRPIQDRHEAIRLFRRSVSMVEVEVFSYCNRRCWFCPNSLIDRQSKTEYMSEELYLHILDQLAGADYRHMISYSRYNEPLAEPNHLAAE